MTNQNLKTEKLLTSSGKFRINLGLERIASILELFGNPQDKINVIHIAGTNGKGSVCTILAEILKTAGYRCGLYTSPHLFSYTERMKINGCDIKENIFDEYVSLVEKTAVEHNIDLTEFEILTAAAYKYFYDNNVEAAVMETGLGGRFDAVNVVKKPVVSVITSISIDHKNRLGDTIEQIAFEKAGIIKFGCPIVINADNYGLKTVKNVAGDKKSELYLADKKIDIEFKNGTNYAVFDGEKHEFGLWGLHQKQNLSLVIKTVEILKNKGFKIKNEDIFSALKTATIPARFQYFKDKNMIVDGSHNEDAAKILRKNLDFYFPNIPRVWIYGSISTKEYDKVVKILFSENDLVYVCKFNHKLSVEEDEIIKNIAPSVKIAKFDKNANTLTFSNKNNLMIVTGSFYMIGEILVNK